MEKVTIGIVCHNEEARILGLLKTLSEFPAEKWVAKIIVVDNSSTDRTAKIVEQFQDQASVNVDLIMNSKNLLGIARSKIVERCATDLLAFVDADCTLPPHWIRDLKNGFEAAQILHPHLAGVCAPNRLPEDQPWKMWVNRFLDSPLGHGNSPQAKIPAKPEPTTHLPTTNALYRVQAIRDVGGFRVDLSKGEDSELGARLHKAHYPMTLLPKPVVLNDSATNFKDWLKRMVRFGQCQWIHSQSRTAAVIVLFILFLIMEDDVFLVLSLASLIYGTLIFVFTKNLKIAGVGLATALAYGLGVLTGPFQKNG